MHARGLSPPLVYSRRSVSGSLYHQLLSVFWEVVQALLCLLPPLTAQLDRFSIVCVAAVLMQPWQ